LPIQYLAKYFKAVGERWQVDEALRRVIDFRIFNLLDSPAPLGVFDVVFCRNVLIYFDQPTKAAVLGRMARQMPQDGFLLLGGAETILGITDRFVAVPAQRGIYAVARAELSIAV
jgi:chemotaxis protein methyltransferase CheR